MRPSPAKAPSSSHSSPVKKVQAKESPVEPVHSRLASPAEAKSPRPARREAKAPISLDAGSNRMNGPRPSPPQREDADAIKALRDAQPEVELHLASQAEVTQPKATPLLAGGAVDRHPADAQYGVNLVDAQLRAVRGVNDARRSFCRASRTPTRLSERPFLPGLSSR